MTAPLNRSMADKLRAEAVVQRARGGDERAMLAVRLNLWADELDASAGTAAGGELPRYHPTPPPDVRAVLSGPYVPLCSREDCYNDAAGLNGEGCAEHEEET